MGDEYTAQQGDHLSGIAKDHGFADFRTIWNDSDNADLEQQRPNPNLLLPGDVISLPAKELRTETRDTGQSWVLTCTKPKLVLDIVLEDISATPIQSSYFLRVKEAKLEGKTDAGGELKENVDPGDRDAELTLIDENLVAELRLKIGFLNPVVADPQNDEEIAGWQARLYNLGYYSGFDPKDIVQLVWAIEEFQRDHGWDGKKKKPTGETDDETRQKLEDVYGC
jgi:hypothetical protein